MRLAAPDFSKMAPIMMPKPMMMPMLPRVPPKPLVTEAITLLKAMPPTSPVTMAAMISAGKA